MTPENYFSLPADADYSAHTGPRFAVVNATGEAVTAGAGAADVVGVITNKPEAAELARIEKNFVDKIEAGTGGLALGDKVKSDSAGKGVTAGTSGDQYHGVCVRAAAAGAIAEFMWARGAVA